MNVRKSVVAGRFYPGSAKDLQGMIAMCLSGASTFFGPNAPVDKDTQDTPCMLMLPHAGYIFSAPVACAALLGTRLPKTVIVLCPNHTGYGRSRFGVWPNGAWETPLGSVPVNAELAQKLAEKTPFGADTLCHAKEHSIEVELPLLQAMAMKQGTDFDIVPVCIASQTNADLKAAGLALADVAEKYLHKGSKVYLEGQLQTRRWEDNNGQERYTTEVVLQNFNGNLVLLDAKGDGVPAGGNDVFATTDSGWDSSAAGAAPAGLDDDIPF